MRDERGFALLAVMLVLALLAVVVTEFAYSARLEASMVRSYRDGVLAPHLAEAGGAAGDPRDPEPGPGHRAGRRRRARLLPRPARARRRRRALPAAAAHPRRAGRRRVLLPDHRRGGAARPQRRPTPTASTGCSPPSRSTGRSATSSTTRSRTGGTRTSCTALHGAESDFYLKLPVPYRARNGNLQDAAELLPDPRRHAASSTSARAGARGWATWSPRSRPTP